MSDMPDDLDDALKQLACAHHVDDDGFTDAVMARLPPPRRPPLGMAVLSVTVVVTCLLGLSFTPIRNGITSAFQNVAGITSAGVLPVSSLVILAVLVWCAWTAAWEER